MQLHSPPGCKWTQEKQFHVDLMLMLQKSGGSYTGNFSPDLFQLGKCGWHLDRVTSTITNGPLIFYNHSLHASEHPLPGLDLTTDVVHLWCARKHEGRAWRTAPNQSVNCVPFSMIGFWAELPDGFGTSIPAQQKNAGSHVVTQYLKTLTIEFHDADASAAAYIQMRPK